MFGDPPNGPTRSAVKNPLLQEDNDWGMITSVLTDVLDAQFGVTVLPNFTGGHLKPVIENTSADQYRLVIPVGQQGGKPVVAVTVNREGLSPVQVRSACAAIKRDTGLLAVDVLEEGAGLLVEALRDRVRIVTT